jgi:hypothetical protein
MANTARNLTTGLGGGRSAAAATRLQREGVVGRRAAVVWVLWAVVLAVPARAESRVLLGFVDSDNRFVRTSTPRLPGSRIRTDSPILRTLIRDASERSQTFRALVAAIDATDGLVYLSVGTCGRLRACLLHRVTLAGEYRVLNILVNLRPLSTDPTPAIGHELQHVLEVLSDSTITTDEGIVAFYRFHGRRIRGVLETDAAIRVGDAIRAELRPGHQSAIKTMT